MNSYNNYQDQILERKSEGLNPLPIDGADLMSDVIEQIKDEGHEHGKILSTSSFTTFFRDNKCSSIKS